MGVLLCTRSSLLCTSKRRDRRDTPCFSALSAVCSCTTRNPSCITDIPGGRERRNHGGGSVGTRGAVAPEPGVQQGQNQGRSTGTRGTEPRVRRDTAGTAKGWERPKPLPPPYGAVLDARLLDLYASGGEAGLQIGLDVVDVLETNRQAHQAGRDTGCELLLGSELRVRGGGRVDDEGLCVAHVGEVREELHVVHHVEAGLTTALDAKDHYAAKAVLEETGSNLVRGVILESRVADPRDLGVVLQPLGDGECVVGMALDAQGQGLEADADELRGVRRERGTKVAQLVG